MAARFALGYKENGRRKEAPQLFVATRKRILHGLVNTYSEVGRRQETLQLLETAVAAKKRTLGKEHPRLSLLD
jgi:hypothetical protein